MLCFETLFVVFVCTNIYRYRGHRAAGSATVHGWHATQHNTISTHTTRDNTTHALIYQCAAFFLFCFRLGLLLGLPGCEFSNKYWGFYSVLYFLWEKMFTCSCCLLVFFFFFLLLCGIFVRFVPCRSSY